MIKEDILKELFEHLDTPYKHQGRLKGIGIDCIGLIISIFKNCGYLNNMIDNKNYDRIPSSDLFLKHIEKHSYKIKKDEIQETDLITFKILEQVNHIGMIYKIENDIIYFIHAFQPAGKVVKDKIDLKWQRRIENFYRFKE